MSTIPRSNIIIVIRHHSAIGTSLTPLALVTRTPIASSGSPDSCM
jgi:hypothetical protein